MKKEIHDVYLNFKKKMNETMFGTCIQHNNPAKLKNLNY